MSRRKPDLKFPFLRNDTRLIEHKNKLYKLKVKYDQESFKGRKVSFTIQDLCMDIEQTFRAVMFMYQNQIELKPIETEFFLIIPSSSKWAFPSKYPNHCFKRNGRLLETSDYMFELEVKHVHVLKEANTLHTPVVERSRDVRKQSAKGNLLNTSQDVRKQSAGTSMDSNQIHVRKQTARANIDPKTSQHSSILNAMKDTDISMSGPLFYRDKDNRLLRNVHAQNHKNSTEPNLHKQSKVVQTKRVKRKSEQALTSLSGYSKKSKRDTDRESDLPSTSHREISRPQPRRLRNFKELQNDCAECAEEHQYRRRSNRLKSKHFSPKDLQKQKKTLTEYRNNSRVDYQLNQETNTCSPRFEKVGDKEKYVNCRISPHGTSSTPTSGPAETTGFMAMAQSISPAKVYQKLIQKATKDRHNVQKLEREETAKLDDLYKKDAPRRSMRQASKQEGRLSGIWNYFGSFFTPRK